MTLTSSPESLGRSLNADFRALKMRIFRKYHFARALTTQSTPAPNAYLYPLIVANIIIINNILTSIAPIMEKQKQKEQV